MSLIILLFIVTFEYKAYQPYIVVDSENRSVSRFDSFNAKEQCEEHAKWLTLNNNFNTKYHCKREE
jgi:hypothetical protein